MKIRIRTIVISIVVIIVGMAVWPAPEIQPIRYVDRQTGDIKTEKVAGGGAKGTFEALSSKAFCPLLV